MRTELRSLLLRFALIVLGMLVLAVGGFVGLGWMVQQQQATGTDYGRWVNLITHNHRLWEWYARTCAGLLPGDADGDGMSDGLELFLGTDPKNQRDNWPMDFVLDDGFDTGTGVYSGERRRLRLHTNAEGLLPLPWPKGFCCFATADAPILIPAGGMGPPTAGPILLTASGGFIEVDILPQYYAEEVKIDFTHPRTRESIGVFTVGTWGWRMPPIPVSFGGGARGATEAVSSPRDADYTTTRGLTWEPPAPLPDEYVIEFAHPDRGAEWVVDNTRSPPETEWYCSDGDWRHFPGYTGPLKFRVIPVRHTRP